MTTDYNHFYYFDLKPRDNDKKLVRLFSNRSFKKMIGEIYNKYTNTYFHFRLLFHNQIAKINYEGENECNLYKNPNQKYKCAFRFVIKTV